MSKGFNRFSLLGRFLILTAVNSPMIVAKREVAEAATNLGFDDVGATDPTFELSPGGEEEDDEQGEEDNDPSFEFASGRIDAFIEELMKSSLPTSSKNMSSSLHEIQHNSSTSISEGLIQESGIVESQVSVQSQLVQGSSRSPWWLRLPPTICQGHYHARYAVRWKLRFREFNQWMKGEFKRIDEGHGEQWLATEHGSVESNQLLKRVDADYFDPIELLPMRLDLPFVAQAKAVFHEVLGRKIWIAETVWSNGGKDLSDFVPSTPYEIRLVAEQIAYGLWELHRAGFIYGNLKPENVRFRKDVRRDPRPNRGDYMLASQLELTNFGLVMPCVKKDREGIWQSLDGKKCGAWPSAKEASKDPYLFKGARVKSEQSKVRVDGKIVYRSFRAPNIKEGGNPYGYEVDWWAFGLLLNQLTRSYCAHTRQPDCLSPRSYNRDLVALVHKLNDPTRYRVLATDAQRTRMLSSDPTEHPVLNDPYFYPVNYHGRDGRPWNDTEKKQLWQEEVCLKYQVLNSKGYYRCKIDHPKIKLHNLCKTSLRRGYGRELRMEKEGESQEEMFEQLNRAVVKACKNHAPNAPCTVASDTSARNCAFECDFTRIQDKNGYDSKARGKWTPKTRSKLKSVCDFVKKDKKGNAAKCNIGRNKNSPRKKCCQCLTSQACKDDAYCYPYACL